MTYDTWLQYKNEERMFKAQRLTEIEKYKEREREEKERKKLMYSHRKWETDKRIKIVLDDMHERKGKNNIYEDYNHIPSYEKLIVNQYFNEQ